MIPEPKAIPSHLRPIVLSPWLAVMGGLALYGITLNHWVTLRSLPIVAQVTGWDWHPLPLPWRDHPMAPLFLAVTAPIRLLPAAWAPPALNLLTAVCAAVTLGLLAASVRLLPHNRTQEQRLRQSQPHALLGIREAFLPVLFAVLMLAGQLAFWQNAVAATGEMLNVLVFAFVIYCILRFRVCRDNRWLLASVFAYGLGDANDWAFWGYLPLYLIAVVWIHGLGLVKDTLVTGPFLLALAAKIFKSRFFWGMILFGSAGHLLHLLIPLLGVIGGGGFSFLFFHQFGVQRYWLLHLVPHWVALLAAACTLFPLLFITFRWPSNEGEDHALGDAVKRFMVHALHLGALAAALLIFFDFTYSPSARMREQPVSFLTFYYMGALAIGYFSGYVLSVLGTERIQTWRRPRRFAKRVRLAWRGLAWALAIGGPALLAVQNIPRIRAGQSGVLDQFAAQMIQALPANGAIVLSDQPTSLYLLQAAYLREGIECKNILIDTEAFPHREYIRWLAARNPALRNAIATNLAGLPPVLSEDTLVPFVALVMRNFADFYLHPSIKEYGEAFYFKPRGLVYELKRFTTSQIQPPVRSEADIASNQAYWFRMESGPLKRLPSLAELDADAAAVSKDYSASLDFWGTELQKANHPKEAHDQFAQALRLNPSNFIARINLKYNERLQIGDHRPLDSAATLYEALYLYRGLGPIITANGPADEPGLDLEFGRMLADRGRLGQATQAVDRRLQFLPGDPEAELAMAKIYDLLGQPAKALALLRPLRGATNISRWEATRCEASALMANHDYPAAEKLLRNAIRQQPSDENRVAALAEYDQRRGMEELREHNQSDATRHFADALTNINLEMQLLASPTHRAVPASDMLACLMTKAKTEAMLKSNGAVAATLSQALLLQPDNSLALLNRAVAEVQLKQFQSAKDDYKKLRKLIPRQSYVVDLGLAEIAAAEKNTAEEMAQLKRCVKSAPEDSDAYFMAEHQLSKLQGQPAPR